MKLKDFNNYHIVNINGQTVKKKSPWPKIFSGLLVTIIIIIVFNKLQPNFRGWNNFTDQIKVFFNYDEINVSSFTSVTIGETFNRSLELLWNTVLYSLLGTIIGIFIAIPIAILSSKNVVGKWYIYTPIRIFMSLVRALPPLIIAFLMFNVFSPTLSATIALSIFVTSIMTKWLFEELDSIDFEAFRSLQALGNSKNRSITKAVFPYLMKTIVSYGVYAFEMVIRFASILGVVGIVTIGSLLSDTYKKPDRWGHMGVVLMVFIVTIIIIEICSLLFKKFILNSRQKQIVLNNKKDLGFKIAQVKQQKSKIWIVKAMLAIVMIILMFIAIGKIEWNIANDVKLGMFKTGLKDIFHPDLDYLTNFNNTENAIILGLEALMVAFAATVIGLILSFLFGILASRAFLGNYFSWIFKILIVSIRAVPAFVYAMIFYFLSPDNKFVFAGVLALGVHSIGMLGKLTYEKLDSIDLSSRKALEVMGSNRIISTRWALIQEAIPTILSSAIYRIEINFKSTVEIGAVGASAFGHNITIFASQTKDFDKLTSFLIVTIFIVLVLEQISNLLRRKLMTGQFVSKNSLIMKFLRKQATIKAIAASETFNLPFKRNEQTIKFNNYVARKMNSSKENKEKYREAKENIKKEMKDLTYQDILRRYA